MAYDHSCVMIVPAASKTDANHLMCALGKDTMPGYTFSAARLSASGSEPATAFGCHTWEEGETATMFLGLATGVIPEIVGEWGDFGLTVQTALAAAEALIVSVMTSGTPIEHLTSALGAAGLQRIVPPDD